MELMKRFIPATALLIILSNSGCSSCRSDKATLNELHQAKDQEHEASSVLELSLSDLMGKKFESNLTITFAGAQKTVNSEQIKVLGGQGNIQLQKALSPSNYIEIVKSPKATAIKDRQGSWRLARENPSFYDELLVEAINPVAWILSELSLTEIVERDAQAQGAPTLSLTNVDLPKDCPLLQNLRASAPFSEVSSAKVSGILGFSTNPKKLTSASLQISVIAADSAQASMHLSLDSKLLTSEQPVAFPQINSDEKGQALVNISRRFQELLGASLGSLGHDK